MNIQATKVKAKGADISIAPGFPEREGHEKDLVIFVRQFATMIDSGLPLGAGHSGQAGTKSCLQRAVGRY